MSSWCSVARSVATSKHFEFLKLCERLTFPPFWWWPFRSICCGDGCQTNRKWIKIRIAVPHSLPKLWRESRDSRHESFTSTEKSRHCVSPVYPMSSRRSDIGYTEDRRNFWKQVRKPQLIKRASLSCRDTKNEKGSGQGRCLRSPKLISSSSSFPRFWMWIEDDGIIHATLTWRVDDDDNRLSRSVRFQPLIELFSINCLLLNRFIPGISWERKVCG